MMRRPERWSYDWEKARTLWCDPTVRVTDVAKAVGCSMGHLYMAAKRFEWPKRQRVYRKRPQRYGPAITVGRAHERYLADEDVDERPTRVYGPSTSITLWRCLNDSCGVWNDATRTECRYCQRQRQEAA